MVSITWAQALAWRMVRQFLEPIGAESVDGVVGRLGSVQGTSEFGFELSINERRSTSHPGDVTDAIADGRLIRTFAFRGAVHLMTPRTAAMYLALRASSRMWELPSWQSFYKLKPADWPDFRAAVRDALANGPLTRADLGTAVTKHARYSHLGFVFTENNWTLLKPLAWQGDITFAAVRGRAMFERLGANPRWKGLMETDAAGVAAVEAYLSAYGPAAPSHLRYWLGSGLGAAGNVLNKWIAALGGRITEIDVEGERRLTLSEHLDGLVAQSPNSTVRLLPAADQWVMGPGTSDPHVTPAARRGVVTRGANVVISSGVVAGTWTLKNDVVGVDWFAEAGAAPRDSLSEEVTRLGTILQRPLSLKL
jgi:hypothetical protein